MDRIGVTGKPGTLKPRGRSGSRYRRMITPSETTMNAVRVPIDTTSIR